MSRPNPAPCQPQAETTTPDYFAEPDWLFQQQGCPDLRIIDVRDHTEYAAGHVPGSLWLERNTLSLTHRDHSVTLVPAALFARIVERLGIAATTTMVVYRVCRGAPTQRPSLGMEQWGARERLGFASSARRTTRRTVASGHHPRPPACGVGLVAIPYHSVAKPLRDICLCRSTIERTDILLMRAFSFLDS